MSFPIIKGLNRSLISSDILTFYNKSTKATNDEYNKIRECIIANVLSFVDFPIEDRYIEQWSYIYILTMNLLEEIGGTSDFVITQTAGRKHNNDFELQCPNNNKFLLELKSNSIPQIASIYCNNPIVIGLDYSGYFFDNYLSKIIGKSVPMINRDEYLRDLNKTKPSLTDNEYFFQYLKENAGKNPLVKESIKTFLEANYMKFNLEALTEYFDKNLTKKIFILYNCSKKEYSILDGLTRDDVHLLRIDPIILNGNTVIIYSNTTRFKFLLRWKNHNGCQGPAWQVSYDYLI